MCVPISFPNTDGDGDTIIISSDDELAQAMEHFKGDLFRLYLKKGELPIWLSECNY